MSHPPQFTVTASRPSPEVHCLEVAGELDLATVPSLREHLDEVGALGPDSSLLIDLARCQFIDSSGLACMVEFWEELDGGGSRFAICSPSDGVRRIFEITGLSTRLHIAEDQAAGLAHVSGVGAAPPA